MVGAPLLISALAVGGGWQEIHETSDDVRLEVGPDGIANVDHHLRYRIVAGHFKTFELAGVDPHAEILPEATLAPEKGGAEVIARVEKLEKPPGTVRLTIDEGKGLARGAYVVDVKYRLDLVSTKMLTRDGAMWKLSWTAPPAPEGHDGARVTFDFPAAATEPRLAAPAEGSTTLATLRRGAERDELELVRPHVSRGDAVAWAARVDPKAFPRVSSPELRPPPPALTAPPSLIASNLARVVVAAFFAALAGALAMLFRAKHVRVRTLADRRGMRARPLLTTPWGLGPFVYGVVSAGALAALLWWSPIGGAALVVLAMSLAAYRAPLPIIKPRGPGAWEPVSDPSVLVASSSSSSSSPDALDLGSTRGRIVFGLGLFAIGAAAWFLRVRIPQIALALPLASAALVPLFATGTRAQMPPAPVDLAARMLRPARDAIASALDLAHVELTTIGRVTAASIDEVRLTGTPKDRTPGLRAIELALATSPGGWGASPEVLVRFDEASPAAKRMDSLSTGARVLRGRHPGEQVVRLIPEEPTATSAAALVARLLVSLEDRRALGKAFRGRDRRARLIAPTAAALC